MNEKTEHVHKVSFYIKLDHRLRAIDYRRG